MQIVDQIRAVREGGKTLRVHTMPYHGYYDVAQHSYNAAALMFLLNPDASKTLIKAILFHDVPERWTGDTPSPAKWAAPELKSLLNDLEQRILENIGLGGLFVDLTEEELHWLHAVDILELYLWARDQTLLGNSHTVDMCMRIRNNMEARRTSIPEPVWDVLINYNPDRLPELYALLK